MAGEDARRTARSVRRDGSRLLAVLAAGVVLLPAGCAAGGGTRPLPTFPPSHDWALVADISGDGPDAEVYRALRTGCDAGQKALESRWDRLTSPREVLLFASAIQMCRGDQSGALAHFQKASTFGWNGLGPDRRLPRCAVFTALNVTLNRVEPAAVSCPGGASPVFVRSAAGVTDNPLTPENEAAPPAPPPAAPATSSSRPPTRTTTATTKPKPTTTTRPRPTTVAPAPTPTTPTTRPKPRTTTRPTTTTPRPTTSRTTTTTTTGSTSSSTSQDDGDEDDDG
ncbi:hypothetical protein GCM10023215_01570 [Pseudonocardia yuanmonensis]|uniref:Uncharacterized protein n=1 Tax=Pseudonocardia yuanmonensis TaxID=1095914 RepID=A0ABP8VWJ1_9PSEU